MGGVSEGGVAPVPVAVCCRTVEHLVLSLGAAAVLVELLWLLLAAGQIHYTLNRGPESVTHPHNDFFGLFTRLPVDQRHDDVSHEFTTFLSLNSIVSGQTLQPRILNCFLGFLPKRNRKGGKSHQ